MCGLSDHWSRYNTTKRQRQAVCNAVVEWGTPREPHSSNQLPQILIPAVIACGKDAISGQYIAALQTWRAW
jgi:hypothetical protein